MFNKEREELYRAHEKVLKELERYDSVILKLNKQIIQQEELF
jgi:hypothetical protein